MSGASAITKDSEVLTAVVIQPPSEDIARPERTHIQSIHWWNQLPRDVWSDLRSAPWTRLGQGYLLAVWLCGLVYVLVTVSLYLSQVPWVLGFLGLPALTASALRDAPGCLPNGEFNPRSMQYNVFNSSGLFQITHGFGELSFTQAKIIDILWDVIVGRVGQMIMAFFEWRALSAYFQCAMFKGPITYNMFWTIYIETQPSLVGTLGVFQDAVLKGQRRSKITAVFIIISMLFIVAFPTLASAMTGYRPNAKAFVEDDTGTLIPFEAFSLSAYVVHDGSRIGLKDGQVIPFTKTVQFMRSSYYVDSIRNLDFPDTEDVSYWCWGQFNAWMDNPDDPAVSSMLQDCELPKRLSDYVQQYGFLGLTQNGGRNDDDTLWTGTTLPKPSLNISAFYLPFRRLNEDYFWGHEWVNPRTGFKPFSQPSNAAMAVVGASTAYSMDYIQQHGTCQPQGTYMWGFTFIQVFIVGVLLLIWTVGTFVLWLVSHKPLMRMGKAETPRKYGAAMVLVSGINREFAATGQDRPQSLTRRQLEQKVKLNLDGGKISAESMSLPVSDYNIYSVLWACFNEHTGWFVSFTSVCIGLGFLALSAMHQFGFFWGLPLHTGIVFALVIGSTPKTRAFFTILGLLLGIVIGLSTLYHSS